MGGPKVTAVMPVFDAARTVRAAIESVQAQTFEDWELVCVDDGSADATAAIVAAMAEADPRIHLHRAPHGGRAVARNLAMAQASGEYVAICDADDRSRPERFELQVGFLDQHQRVFAVGGGLAPYADPTALGTLGELHWPASPAATHRRFAQLRMGVPHPAAMFRREQALEVGPYEPHLHRCQDLDFFVRADAMGMVTANLGVVLVDYHQPQGVRTYRDFCENADYQRLVVEAHAARSRSAVGVASRFGRPLYPLRYAEYRVRRRLSGSNA